MLGIEKEDVIVALGVSPIGFLVLLYLEGLVFATATIIFTAILLLSIYWVKEKLVEKIREWLRLY
jgi:hypothetical protein